jgi:hypothetical protein
MPRSTLAVAAAVALVACSPNEATQPTAAAFRDNFVRMERVEGPRFVEILEVRMLDGDTLAYCSGVQGLNLVDVSDRSAPQWLQAAVPSLGSGHYPRCQHLAVDGARVYISNRGDEIQKVPFITAFDRSGGMLIEGPSVEEDGVAFEGIAAGDGHVFAATHTAGVQIYQHVDGALTWAGRVDGLNNAFGLSFHGGLLYIADGTGGLVVADVSTPNAASVVGRLPLEGSAQTVELDEGTMVAFVGLGSAGVATVDVRDAAAPSLLARVDTPGTALQIALANGHAFVADWNDTRVYDVRDASAPVLVATERIAVEKFPRVLGIAAVDNYAFLGEWTGLYSYELRDEPRAPDIRVTPTSIDVGMLATGERAAAALAISNDGRAPLTVSTAELRSSSLELSVQLPLVIEPGGVAALEIQLRALTAEPRETLLRIGSDDPDEGRLPLEVSSNVERLGVGDPAPEVYVAQADGGLWRLSEHRGEVVVLAYFATY